jgi:hypothetical protein
LNGKTRGSVRGDARRPSRLAKFETFCKQPRATEMVARGCLQRIWILPDVTALVSRFVKIRAFLLSNPRVSA